jgi:DNA gyrase/topoisomerase IV subunit B
MTYEAKDIHVLAEMEHIQLNPGMYIGETANPVHLIEEALDNALDEALAGYATIIAVDINPETGVCSVIDNGRGIPLEKNTPVTISTKLFSGGKFKNKKSAYKISSGLHGVGLVAINALSSKYMIDVYRDGKHGFFYFEEGKLKKSKISEFTNQVPYSTKVEFIPSTKYFESIKPDLDRIRKRLTTASAELGTDMYFVMKVGGEKEVFNRTRIEHFKAECGITEEDFSVIALKSQHKDEKFEAFFGYEEDGPIGSKVVSSVNLLPVDRLGTHYNVFLDLLKTFFLEKAKKNGYKFQGNDVTVRLRAYLVLYILEPELSGQTKERLTNRKSDFDKYIKVFRSTLDQWADDNPDSLNEYLEKFQSYRKKVESKNLQKTDTGGRRASTKFTKLRDCSQPHGELYIVEGTSAGGSIIQSRDPLIHAVLPLRGKSIPNITSAKNILKNKEVGELIMALGMGVEPHCDISNLRYDRVVCATDADPDGAHIACLLTMAIAILIPDLIREGKYFIAQTPLFAINEKRTFKPLWTEKQLAKAREDGRTISRFKGLGELNPNQLKICLLQESTRHHIPVKYSDDIDELLKLFSDVDAKRKLVSENEMGD